MLTWAGGPVVKTNSRVTGSFLNVAQAGMKPAIGAPPVYKPYETAVRVDMAPTAAQRTASPFSKLAVETRPAPPVYRPQMAPVPPRVMQSPVRFHHPPPLAVQRYKAVPAASQTATNYNLNYDLRVSDDGKMAVKDTGNATPNGSNQYQDLYLAPEVFNRSQQALNNANSGVTLTQTATTIRGKPPDNHIKRTLHLITIQFADTPNNESYAGCNANAWNVMGT
jgi:hypothetical protein